MCNDDAVKSGLISSNVVHLTKAPKLSKKEIAVLSKEKIARLIDTAKKIESFFCREFFNDGLRLRWTR